MNITRHNYEEFFMLYADNELSDEQRSAVDMFVEANPDLKPELDLFFSLKMDSDSSVSLGDKSFLFRKETAIPEAMQTEMLLHLDNELPTSQAASLEASIREDKSLQQEWEILMRAKLHPDLDIRFPDRQLLYRQAAAGGTVLRIRWVRYAAAAAVVLIAGLLWLNRPDGDATLTGPASLARVDSGSPLMPGQNQETATADLPVQIKGSEAPAQQSTQSTTAAEKQLASVSIPRKAASQMQTENTGAEQQRAQTAPQEPVSLQLAVKEPVARERTEAVAQIALPENTTTGALVQEGTVRPAVMTDVKTDYASQALAMQQQGSNYENAYRESDKERKGFRGLVRKANRIFNKVTNPDLDGTVVKVANVQIGLGR